MTRRSRSRTFALVAVALLATLALIGSTSSADTTTPPQNPPQAVVEGLAAPTMFLSYQGRLLDSEGNPVRDNPYTMGFTIYDDALAGIRLWTEKRDVTVSKGLFSVLLGEVTPLDPGIFDGRPLWLAVNVDSDSEAVPRIRVAHVPYAIWSNLATNAANADRLGGSLPSAYAAATHSHDAANITAGNLSTDRYHAVDDLSAEDYLGNAAGDIALNNGAKQATLNADMLDGQHSTDFAGATHNHDAAYVNVTGDTMSGVLTLPRVAYTAPRTHYVSVPGEAFNPWVDVAFGNSGGCGGAYVAASGCHALVAPVQLPDGATVNQFTVFFQDTSSYDMTVTLYRQFYTGCGFVSLAEVNSSGTSGYHSVQDSASAVVDNTTGGYHVKAYSCNWSSSLLIKGAVIRYTISEAP